MCGQERECEERLRRSDIRKIYNKYINNSSGQTVGYHSIAKHDKCAMIKVISQGREFQVVESNVTPNSKHSLVKAKWVVR